MKTELKLAQHLIRKSKTISIAESCTGGLLSHRLTNVPGSSLFLKTAIVAYSNASKTKLLKITEDTLKKHGAVSQTVAIAMAKNVRKMFKTNYGVGITGILGPSGATKLKPVGLVYIAVATDKESICLKCKFTGSRISIKSQATTQALKLILEFLI